MGRRLRKLWYSLPRWGKIDSIVYAPPGDSGGVKSLYTVCGWLGELGKSTIVPFDGNHLVNWFPHRCTIFDEIYTPHVVVYPEVHQPNLGDKYFHICFALGKYGAIQPHADLVVCKTPDMVDWIKAQHPHLSVALIRPSIERSVFEYDGRPKQNLICYMTKPHKHPETAELLRERYGSKLVEIINQPEVTVAEILKDAKVFVWRSNDKEGSPRPPKEALVAGCQVVGLESDLHKRFRIDFGIKCATVDELIEKAGEALKLPIPTVQERAIVNDSVAEKEDWLRLVSTSNVKAKRTNKPVTA
jgi:hypothetical protein